MSDRRKDNTDSIAAFLSALAESNLSASLRSWRQVVPLLLTAIAMLAALVLSLSLVVSYIKARAESLGFACNVGIAERPERVIVLGFALLLGHAEAGLWVLVAGTAITVVQRILVVWQQSDVGPDIGR